MAYFIVIGTNNNVKNVVDEIKKSHLQHNVITSGCILNNDDGLYYHWDVFNEKGNKTKENNEPVELHDALTNQISQFKTLIPDDAISNVFIVSQCFDEYESETLQVVCDELYEIGGAMLSGLFVDIVLVGYDINKPENVTIRPDWRLLESLKGLWVGRRFKTDILYINNMDYMGAATNIDSQVLAKFLCQWSKVVCSGDCDPKATITSHVYAIGMAEYQYDFRDLNDFFKLSAEERLLERTLHNQPSIATNELISSNYYKKIDLNAPWIDGLCSIKSIWESYCSGEWDSSKILSENQYSISQQEQTIASYLNSYLKLYISEEQREIDILLAKTEQAEDEKAALLKEIDEINNLPDNDEEKKKQINENIAQLDLDISNYYTEKELHESNISRNNFYDADTFCVKYGGKIPITEDEESECEAARNSIDSLIQYVKSEGGIAVMREAVKNATISDILPEPYPASEIINMGRVTAIVLTQSQIPSMPLSHPQNTNLADDEMNTRSGCLFWFKSLFEKNKSKEDDAIAHTDVSFEHPERINPETVEFLNDALNKSVAALRKADEVRMWWSRLCEMIEAYQKRQADCKRLMDGEMDANDRYLPDREGFRPRNHMKSVSLIDMDLVRNFRDTDSYYITTINRFLDRWFDTSLLPEDRMTMPELIKHQVLDPLVGKFHTLGWDGHNPFVNELLTDPQLHEIIEFDIRQSKPFVEYVMIHDSNLASNLSVSFFSNNQNIPTKADEFRNKYNIGSSSIQPIYLKDFANSLCVIQVLDIPDYVDALRDFKPQRVAELGRFHINIESEVATIVRDASSTEGKARAIYNWLCENIAFDTTKQIHDAETCYKTRRGVCQAYCELFCNMAECVGLTADIIVGKTKNAEGKISDNKHAWIFVYTNAYDGILIDPTWGAGGVDGVTFVKNKDNSMWFNVSPYWMAFSHFPGDSYWTKLGIAITEEQFEKLPFAYPQMESDGKDALFENLSKIS